uniref:isoprenyl transferase n=1 Tax=Prochlorothrix hollandica TaxID=1223 RepID=UPI00333F509D
MTVQPSTTHPLPPDLNSERMPHHVAVIMDGNGRWAQQRGLPRLMGHRQGVAALKSTVYCCSSWGIPALTVYGFSAENWGRPRTEVDFLMELINHALGRELDEMISRGVCLRVVGDLNGLPPRLQTNIEQAMVKTRQNQGVLLTLALNYGGRQEIIEACRHIATQVQQGHLAPEDINDELFGRHVFTPSVGDPDLLIRTSGEMRISNFLLWQLAYSEIYVTPTLWPDFDQMEFHRALCDYQQRHRRFGKL